MNTKPRDDYWPTVTTLPGVQQAIRTGYVGAYFAAVMTVVAVTIMDWTVTERNSGIVTRLPAGVFLAIGVGIQLRSRTAAVLGLLLIPAAALIAAVALGHLAGYLVASALFLSLLNGVRGTFAYHRLKSVAGTARDDLTAVPGESDSLAEEAPAHYDHEWRSFYSVRHGEVPLFKDRCECYRPPREGGVF